MNKIIKYAGIAGILLPVFMILSIFLLILSTSISFEGSSDIITILLLWLSNPFMYIIIIGIPTFFFIWGFKVVAEKTNNNLLKIASYLLIIITIITILFPIVDTSLSLVPLIIIGTIGSIVSILFGIGLLRLKDQFGSIANYAGILFIIYSIIGLVSLIDIDFFVIINGILGFFETPLLAITLILGIIILFRASEILD